MPRAPLPGTSVTRVRVASSTTSKGITPSSSLIRAHAPNQLPPPDSCGFVYPHFFPAVLAGCCEPPAGNRFFPTLSPQFFPEMPGPQPRRSHRVHVPVSSSVSSAFPRPLSSRLLVSSAQTRFSAVRFQGGHRTFLTFKPPSLLVSQIAPTAATFAGRPRLLLPGRTYFVASAHTGYGGERTFTFPDLRPCRLLQGPTLIYRADYSHGCSVHDELLIRVLLQHTIVKNSSSVRTSLLMHIHDGSRSGGLCHGTLHASLIWVQIDWQNFVSRSCSR